MRIAVLETNQKPEESPSRHVSKKRAAKFIARKIARWLIPDKLLQMTKDDDTIRGDWEHFRAQIDVIPVKRKQWNQNLLISYPLADQRSNPAY